MRVLVLGLGSIGMRHARNFLSCGVDCVEGLDPEADRRAYFNAETGGRTFVDLNAALAQKPDLVVIASPNRHHLPQAMAAARAGCALFIEKPLGSNLEQAQELAELAQARGLYCHYGSNWKFHPAFEGMKRWIDEGLIGAMTSMQVLAGQWLPDWHPWEDFRKGYSARKDLDGGAVFDTHELDYILWLGGPVKSFMGLISQSGLLPIETEDNAAALMRLANGALVTLQTDYIQRQGLRRYLIAGELGTIEWSTRDHKLRFYASREDGVVRNLEVDVALADMNEMYMRQTKRILEDIRTSGSSLTPLAHVLDVLRLQLAWRSQKALNA